MKRKKVFALFVSLMAIMSISFASCGKAVDVDAVLNALKEENPFRMTTLSGEWSEIQGYSYSRVNKDHPSTESEKISEERTEKEGYRIDVTSDGETKNFDCISNHWNSSGLNQYERFYSRNGYLFFNGDKSLSSSSYMTQLGHSDDGVSSTLFQQKIAEYGLYASNPFGYALVKNFIGEKNTFEIITKAREEGFLTVKGKTLTVNFNTLIYNFLNDFSPEIDTWTTNTTVGEIYENSVLQEYMDKYIFTLSAEEFLPLAEEFFEPFDKIIGDEDVDMNAFFEKYDPEEGTSAGDYISFLLDSEELPSYLMPEGGYRADFKRLEEATLADLYYLREGNELSDEKLERNKQIFQEGVSLSTEDEIVFSHTEEEYREEKNSVGSYTYDRKDSSSFTIGSFILKYKADSSNRILSETFDLQMQSEELYSLDYPYQTWDGADKSQYEESSSTDEIAASYTLTFSKKGKLANIDNCQTQGYRLLESVTARDKNMNWENITFKQEDGKIVSMKSKNPNKRLKLVFNRDDYTFTATEIVADGNIYYSGRLIAENGLAGTILAVMDVTYDISYTDGRTGSFLSGRVEYDGTGKKNGFVRIEIKVGNQSDDYYIVIPVENRKFIDRYYLETRNGARIEGNKVSGTNHPEGYTVEFDVATSQMTIKYLNAVYIYDVSISSDYYSAASASLVAYYNYLKDQTLCTFTFADFSQASTVGKFLSEEE